ncbi:winged helix-turn-helix domain-containing protein [Shinella kummerowiae]|uniref:winged helix-turn-helix domain-containing protein n=1 Tax=Shinella kummerowiae TaxID=417745 RepID=UPI0021B4FF51|nr:winged helix-turn-helix domain-containing protein [Shinella kummerowiae]
MYFFADFVLDTDRAELRRVDGSATRLRPKTLELFKLLVQNSHRVLGKEELMEAIWPGIHVGEDSLFQCIREIRVALGDARREMVQVISGRGYLFALDVTTEQAASGTAEPRQQETKPDRKSRRGLSLVAVAASVLSVMALIGFALHGNSLFAPSRVVVVLQSIVDTDASPEGVALARDIASELVKGFSRIDGIHLIVREGETVPALHGGAALDLRYELKRDPLNWILQARLIDTANQEIQAVAETSASEADRPRLIQRLAAGIGYPLGLRLSELQEPEERAATPSAVAIRQAVASINQTTRERFGTARAILEQNLAEDPDNVELQIALAGLHLRGMQMNWYDPAQSAVAEQDAAALLKGALASRPRSLPVLDAYCRFLTVTNQFTESLVVCARALTVNPWDGTALYNLGLTQLQLGRFDDALASFLEAERYDTPEVSRWTWLLGAGWANLLLGRNEEAATFLQRSIAITAGSGRPYLLLAAAYQRLGRAREAREALAKAMEMRPGSTARNVALPTRNASNTFLAGSNAIIHTLMEIGLPSGTPR